LKLLIEKNLNILDYSLASLWRRKLKNLTVMLVFALVIFLLASFQMLTSALTKAAEDSLAHAPDITVQKMSAGRQTAIPLTYIEQLHGIWGIQRIVPRIWGYYFDEKNLANYTILGVDTWKMPAGHELNLALAEGHFPQKNDTGLVVLGHSVHKGLNLDNRKVFSFFRPDLSLESYKISGIFSQSSEILTADIIVMNLEDARKLFAIPTEFVTDLCVYVGNPAEINTIGKKIANLFPDTRVLTRSQILKTYQMVFSWRSGFASVCLLTALAAFAILAWDKASGLSPEERREIAILKILGWETSDVLAIRFWESFLVSFIAFAFGCSLAYLHVVFFDASLFRPVLMGWSVIRPNLQLLPNLEVADLLLILCYSVLPYMAATVIPAWRCAIVPADSAMRG
jgi:ABC-type lipoprotein release transport system permease subunit